ncbi:MAG: amino acid aminotransferase [Pseudomonadota bacterium]
MFKDLSVTPPDPILGLSQLFADDPNPNKVGLTVGVFQDASGQTPILPSVKTAEQELLARQASKAYIGQAGDPAYLDGMRTLLLGDTLAAETRQRVELLQTPGGCGAVRIGAELAQMATRGRIWVSTPTWANHYPLLEAAGLRVFEYPYYDVAAGEIDFEAMLIALGRAEPEDLVLLHGGCHNPTGADLTETQWDQVISLCAERTLIPFIDNAYQGFAYDLDRDAYGIRQAVANLPTVLVAASCSKNFGLYRERTGALLMAMDSAATAAAACSQSKSLARRSYTMAPYHGGGIAGFILGSAELRAQWTEEVAAMRGHLDRMRIQLAEALAARQAPRDFSFIATQRGMFSLLGLSQEQVLKLREDYGIYALGSSRINVAGLADSNIDYVADGIVSVLRDS